jgi:ADP-ribose pyrophosphatase YjhB (NUDIX family)
VSHYADYEIKVFLYLRNAEGKYLFMLNNHPDSIIHGYINPGGGHVEPGETISQAVRREVKEETGITKLKNIQVKGVINVVGFKEKTVLMFIVSADVVPGQKARTRDEGEPVWVDIHKLDGYKVLADVALITKLVEDTPPGKIFQASSLFKDRKLVSFTVEP